MMFFITVTVSILTQDHITCPVLLEQNIFEKFPWEMHNLLLFK